MSEGYKKAALRIHCLSEVDRRWLLNELPERERNELDALLAQLNEMKVPGGRSTFSHLIDSVSGGFQDSIAVDHNSSLSKNGAVNAVDPAIVIPVLTREPDWLVALVLLCDEWSWTKLFVQSLDHDRRARIYNFIKRISPQLQPKLRETIVELLVHAFSVKQSNAADGATSRFEVLFGTSGLETFTAPEGAGKAL